MRHLLMFLSALAIAAPSVARTPPAQTAAPKASPALEARAKELVAILSGRGSYDSFFAPGFRTNVPKEKFDAINAQLTAANGPVQGVGAIEPATPYSAIVKVNYRDAVATLRLVVDEAEPHQVSGLRVLGMSAREQTLADVRVALEALPGRVGYAIAKLDEGGHELLMAHNAQEPFAVGSAFKLVILAELVRATNAGERKWDDMVTLDGSQLPGGGYATRPKGSEVSLRELATQMISVSDNSATDVLLKTLGREKVEAMLPVLGVRDDPRNRPFLGTLEAFKLKYLSGGAFARRYADLDTAGRRALLAGEIARIPLIAIPAAPEGGRKPAMIDQIEWFLSPADLVRVMDWLRRRTATGPGAEARAILSKNPGLPPAAAGKWKWGGFKGGSEPGVMNMTLLLEGSNGTWFVVTGSWNDTAQDVQQGRFAGLIGRAAELAAP